MTVVATAGHVDHGKSALVRALTGVDPDRWEEERRRGLTIDLGFAATRLPSGRELELVDVPGHVRFLRNMLAGAGAVRHCLFAVDAREGWKPQSEEHLRVLDLLGVERGIVALTKIAGLDPDDVELVRLEVSERVAGTFLAGAAIVATDAVGRIGLEELRAALDRMLANTTATPGPSASRPRLWIDRAFTMHGAGTVVTGTLVGGCMAVDDELVVVPGRHATRVRGLHHQHHRAERAEAGSRVALNLARVGVADCPRGAAVVAPETWHVTDRVDAELTVLPTLDHTVSRRGAYFAYIGSGEHYARLRVLGPEALAPGTRGFVRLHLERALPLLPGDRFVLRESGRSETVGGGEVLDVEPLLPAARARPDRSVERVVAERGAVDADHLERLTGVRLDPTIGRFVTGPAHLDAVRGALAERLAAAGTAGLAVEGLNELERLLLDERRDLRHAEGRVAMGGDGTASHPWLDALATSPLAPPPPDGVDRALLRSWVRDGTVVDAGGVHFARAALELAARSVAELLAAHPEGVTVAQVRDRWGNTRKHALPLLAWLDANGHTRRRGDVRVAGPRLPRV